MICTFIFLLFVNLTTSLQDIDIKKNTTSGHSLHDNVLCRGCGNEITFSSSIISKVTPSSQYSYHDSLFNRDEVLIQVLISDFFLPNPVITTSKSNCVGITEWEEADSWFPGYRWKPCVCPECGALVGWVFELINPSFVDQPEVFFSLFITSLVGESFLNSLTIVPGEQSGF